MGSVGTWNRLPALPYAISECQGCTNVAHYFTLGVRQARRAENC